MRTCSARNSQQPAVLWLCGFRSDITGSKATALFNWAKKKHRSYRCFDYFAHGASEGAIEDFTLSHAVEDTLSVITDWEQDHLILAGSSMGGWVALRVMQILNERKTSVKISGMVLVAPAADFTEQLIWEKLDPKIKNQVMESGLYRRPSAYAHEPYIITRKLIEDGRKHLILDKPFRCSCPIHILHGTEDEDVPWQHSLKFMSVVEGSITLSLVKGGDHRLSQPEHIDQLIRAIEAMR